jgi:hypothetical protein
MGTDGNGSDRTEADVNDVRDYVRLAPSAPGPIPRPVDFAYPPGARHSPSTTHTITGAIVGVGSLRRLSAVRWGVAGQVVWAWVLTIPGTALVSGLCWGVLALLD